GSGRRIPPMIHAAGRTGSVEPRRPRSPISPPGLVLATPRGAILTPVWRARWPGMTWLTLLATAAVVAINVAGLWEITAARASLVDGARRMLGLETVARAGILEARLAQTRGDLAFMAGSPVFFDLKTVLASRDPREARWRRLEAEGAVLLFLRGH